MKIQKLESFYIINSLKNHKEIKKEILNTIDKMPHQGGYNDIETITKTDWSFPKDYPREYIKIFYENITPIMNKIADFMFCQRWSIKNTWYNQYYKNDKVDWHNHPDSNFANVYYLELPEKSMKTQFFDIKTKKIIEGINVEEGDVLTFPAYFLHRSNTNIYDKRKTVIAFNSCFDGTKPSLIDSHIFTQNLN